MIENIFKSLNVIFLDIKDCSSLVLEHPHTSDSIYDVLGQELSEDSPNEGDGLESLLELNLNGDAVFLSSEETSRMQGLLVMARKVSKCSTECFF